MTKLVSVIIPCYNQARFLPDTVESVLSQTYPQIQIIVIDDGSTDSPQTALTAYGDSIQLVQQPNRGLAAARNAGYQIAKGEYLWFLDSDDTLNPDAITKQVAELESHPDMALSYAAWRQVSEDGQTTLNVIRPHISGQVLEALLLRRFFFFASSTLMRRSILEQIGIFDETLTWGEDADLWLRIASAGYPFSYIDEPLMNYRVHSNSMTAQIRPEQSKSWVAQLDKFFSDPQLTTQIQELKAEAYAILHYETAGRFYRAGHLELAKQHLSDAMRANPQVDENWLLEWIAGTALDPRTANPDQFVNWAVASLKAQGLGLSRRAQGRYHIASAFEAFRLHHYPQIRAQLLPALTSDPSVAFNRGFIRIALEALVRK